MDFGKPLEEFKGLEGHELINILTEISLAIASKLVREKKGEHCLARSKCYVTVI